MENEKKGELTTRDVVRIVRKEIIANRNETTALRAEIAVMRTELSGIHKVMQENKLFIQSIALSMKAIRETMVGAGESLEIFFTDVKDAVKELIPAIEETRYGPVGKEETEDETSDDNDDGEYDDVTPTEPEEPERCERCSFTIEETNSSKLHRCCLEKGHTGDHSYKCESPLCPGYPWFDTSKNPHPMTTCHIGNPKMTRMNPETFTKPDDDKEPQNKG